MTIHIRNHFVRDQKHNMLTSIDTQHAFIFHSQNKSIEISTPIELLIVL